MNPIQCPMCKTVFAASGEGNVIDVFLSEVDSKNAIIKNARGDARGVAVRSILCPQCGYIMMFQRPDQSS